MEPPIDLLPNALFSPSKAAAQRAQAQDWHAVDAWLSARYQGRSIPQFERGEDTLRALLALAAANERADDERDLLWAAQKEAAAELSAAKERRERAEDGRAQAQRVALVAGLERGLSRDGRACLDAMAAAAAALDVVPPPRARRRRGNNNNRQSQNRNRNTESNSEAAPPPPTIEMGIACAAARRTLTVQAMARQLAHLQQLQRALDTELASLRAQALELRGATAAAAAGQQAPAALQRQTLDWTRNTKLLRAKLAEYADRLAAMAERGAGAGGEDVAGLVAQERRNGVLEDKLAAIETEISAYKGLPANREAAVEEVRKMEEEVARLEGELDRQFEGLVEKG
jgi:HAUS augmin-like complex subunit 1